MIIFEKTTCVYIVFFKNNNRFFLPSFNLDFIFICCRISDIADVTPLLRIWSVSDKLTFLLR